MHAPARGSCRFGPFEIDLDSGELRKRERRLRLQEKPLRILIALLEHPGEMVARQQLHERLWSGDTFVDFDHGLNNAVNKLRFALGHSARAPRFIETIGRRGYRFIGTLIEPGQSDDGRVHPPRATDPSSHTVEDVAPPFLAGDASELDDTTPPAEVPAVSQPPIVEPAPASPTLRVTPWVAGACAAAAIGGLIAVPLFRPVPDGWRWLRAGTPTATVDAASGIRGVAVLPLANLSGDPGQNYMAY